jgi:hypothetical protein
MAAGTGGIDDSVGAGAGAGGASELELLELLLWWWQWWCSVTAAAGLRRWRRDQCAQRVVAAGMAAARHRYYRYWHFGLACDYVLRYIIGTCAHQCIDWKL